MPNNFRAFLLAVLTVQMLPGCTTRAWYETLQVTSKQACQRQLPTEQERCESRLNKEGFDTYEKNRLRETRPAAVPDN